MSDLPLCGVCNSTYGKPDKIVRKFEDLVAYLYRETSFPNGCFLMTGTGIVPGSDFTLAHGDEIIINIDHIGKLVNWVG